MLKLPKRVLSGRFARDEAGGITAESVMWIPVYMVFFALIVDVSLVLNAQAKARHIVQDANRHASTGYLVTEDDLVALMSLGVSPFSPNATITATIGAESVSSTIEMPVSDLEAVGLFGRFSDLTITVSSLHLLEI